MLEIDLVDLCPGNQDATVLLIDTSNRQRFYDVPNGWTFDTGYDTLDLTTLDPQVGQGGSVAIGVEDPDFDPTKVVRMVVWFASSAALDNMKFKYGPCPLDPCLLGACCLGGGQCVIESVADCFDDGGSFRGPATTCDECFFDAHAPENLPEESFQPRSGRPSADVNGDGNVDYDDLGAMLQEWGDCPPAGKPCPGDLDGNGIVDALDLKQLVDVWR